MLASPSGVNPDFEQQVTEDGATEDEPEGLEKNARRGESGDRAPGGALSGIYANGAPEAPGQAGVPPLVLGGSQRMPSVGAANVVEQRM